MTDLEHIEPGYVYLNGTRFKLKSPISPVVLSTPPPVAHSANDPDKSETILNTFIYPDGRSGIGLYKVLDADQVNYSWFSTCYSYRNNVGLPEEVVTLSVPALTNPALQQGFDYGNFWYEIWNGHLYQRNPATLTLGSSIIDFAGSATDVVTYNYSGALYVWVAANGVLYKGVTDPSVFGNWTNTTQPAKFLLVWDNKLLRVDSNNHTVVSVDNGATWGSPTLADVPVPVGWVQGLFVFFDPNGNLAPYASTRLGIWYLDYSTGLWHESKLTVPPNPFAGLGFGEWHNDLYFSAGLDVYRYIVNVIATVSNAGLNQNDGVPSSMRGNLTKFVKGQNELYALLDSSQASALTNTVYTGGSYRGIANPFTFPAVPTKTGYSSVLAWNGARWRVLWRSGASATAGSSMFMTQANGVYRLVWGTGNTAYYTDVPQTIVNPLQNPIQRFQGSCFDEKPWFNAQMFGRKKLAVIIVGRARNTSANRTITVEYALDLNDNTWYPARDFTGNINNVVTSDGIFEFTLEPNLVGLPYDWIKFRVTLATNDPTQSPSVEYIGHYYADIPRQRWGYTFSIEIDNEGDGGNTAKMLNDALKALMPDTNNNPQLARMQYRSAQSDTSQDMRVLVYRVVGNEASGNDFRGQYTVSVGRVYP